MEVAINERATTTAARVMTNRRRQIAGRERVMGWAGRGGGKLGLVWDLGSLAGLKGVARVIPLIFLGLRFFMWSARAQRQLAREERKYFLLPHPLQKLLKWASSCISDGLTRTQEIA